MKAKKVCQVCLVVSGLLVALIGIACLVVGTLLNHDSDLSVSHESKSRTYGTQYWLGLPLIAFGGYVILISPSLHERKHLVAISLFLCIPLITCCLVTSILHGSAYIHFFAIHQNRLFLEDHSYICVDGIKDASTQCQCAKTDGQGSSSDINLPVPCAQQKSLSSYHGSLLAFSVTTFALLLGILVICIILLLNVFKLQLAMSTTSEGRNNEGFSDVRVQGDSNNDRNTELSVLPHHASLSTLTIPEDNPPSYESLLSPFDMSHGMTLHNLAPFPNDASRQRERISAVNGQARPVRVRYRGQLSSSRLNNQIPGRAEHGETVSNDVSNSTELQHAEAQTGDNNVDESVPPNNESFSDERRQERLVYDQQNNTESTSSIYNQSNSFSHEENEAREEATALDNRNESRSEENREPTLETRRLRESVRNTQPFFESSSQITSHQETYFLESNGSSRNLNGQPDEIINARLVRNDSNRNEQPSCTARNPSSHVIGDHHHGHVQITPERENSSGQITPNSPVPCESDAISQGSNIRNGVYFSDYSVEMASSELRSHPSLERTISNNSEDGIYIDITQNSTQDSNSAVSNDDSITERYSGLVDSAGSIQTHFFTTRGHNTSVHTEAHQDETNDCSNDVGCSGIREQTTLKFNNTPSVSTATGTNEDSLNDDRDISNDNSFQKQISEDNALNPQNSDTTSISSFETMSI